MGRVIFVGFILLALCLTSFVSAATTGSARVNFAYSPDSGENLNPGVEESPEISDFLNIFLRYLVVLLVALVFYLVYKTRKKSPTKAKNLSKKKVSKKIVRKSKK